MESKEESTVKRLIPKVTISGNPSEVFCVKFNPDGQYVATGCADGQIRVFDSLSGRLAYHLQVKSSLPTTCLEFRPAGASKTKNVLVSGNADGTISHWHVTSGKCLHTIEDPENQVYCLDYQKDGKRFATGGKDHSVTIYDEATKSVLIKLESGVGHIHKGHSNRVFSVKFHPEDENIVVSGGWDNTVHIWDLRTERSVRSFYGPHICGDALDLHKNTILTGSWTPENALQTWDIETGELNENIEWQQSRIKTEPCLLYAAQFSKDKHSSLIAAGGSGACEAKVFDRAYGNKVIGTIGGLKRGVFSLDWFGSTRLAIAGGDCSLRIIDVVNMDKSESLKLGRPETANRMNYGESKLGESKFESQRLKR